MEKQVYRISRETMNTLWIVDYAKLKETIEDMLSTCLRYKPYVKVCCQFRAGSFLSNELEWNNTLDIQRSQSPIFDFTNTNIVTMDYVFGEVLNFSRRVFLLNDLIPKELGHLRVRTMYGDDEEDSEIRFNLDFRNSYIYYQYYILWNKEFEKYLDILW